MAEPDLYEDHLRARKRPTSTSSDEAKRIKSYMERAEQNLGQNFIPTKVEKEEDSIEKMNFAQYLNQYHSLMQSAAQNMNQEESEQYPSSNAEIYTNNDNLEPEPLEVCCQICNELIEFNTKEVLYQHYIQHYGTQLLQTNLGTDGLFCSYCKQQQPSPYKLAEHLGIYHDQLELLLPSYMKYKTIIENILSRASKSEEMENVNMQFPEEDSKEDSKGDSKEDSEEDSKADVLPLPEVKTESQEDADSAAIRQNDFSTTIKMEFEEDDLSEDQLDDQMFKDEVKNEISEKDFESSRDAQQSVEEGAAPAEVDEDKIHHINCKICNNEVKFITKRHLYRHYLTHFQDVIMEMNKDNELECVLCGKKYATKTVLQMHICIVHKKLDDLLQDDMKYEYIKTVEIGEKIVSRTPQRRPPIILQCKICQQIIKVPNKRELYKHYVSHHFQEQIREINSGSCTFCTFCGKQLCDKRILFYHVGVTHKKLDLVLPDMLRYENVMGQKVSGQALKVSYRNGIRVDNSNPTDKDEKFSPIIAQLVAKLKWPEDRVHVLKTKLLHESSKEFICCYHCQMLMIGQKSYLRAHVISHYSDQILNYPLRDKCSVCYKNAGSRASLVQHYARGHRVDEKVIPKDQLNSIKVSDYLEEDHETVPMESHGSTSEEQNPKSVSDVSNSAGTTSDKFDMSQYLNVQLQEPNLENPVKVPDEPSYTETFLANLEKQSEKPDEAPFTHSILDNVERRQQYEETTEVHKEMKLINCEVCKGIVKFRFRTELYRHYVGHYHEQLEDINYKFNLQCFFCGKKFADNRELYRHVGVVHNKVEPLLPESMKYDYIIGSGRYHDHAELNDLKKMQVENEVEKLPPVVQKLAEKLGFPNDKIKIVTGRVIENHMFMVCPHCHMLVIGETSNIKRHMVRHYQEEIINYPDVGKCDKCWSFRKKTEIAFHYGLQHAIAKKVIPRKYMTFVKISSYMPPTPPPSVVKTEPVEVE